MAFTTFIMPTIGRKSLHRTLASLLAQTDPDFDCLVIFDGIERTIPLPDTRFEILRTPMKLGIHEGELSGQSQGGRVRNYGIERVGTRWISFVDDDDTVTEDYVTRLKEEASNNDVVIFKMLHPILGVLPPAGCTELINGQVGISFSVRKTALDLYGIRFVNGGIEDLDFLSALEFYGAKIHFSPYVTYHVRQ
jgi:glycosyltransferase involved in cell wall biosynthesis